MPAALSPDVHFRKFKPEFSACRFSFRPEFSIFTFWASLCRTQKIECFRLSLPPPLQVSPCESAKFRQPRFRLLQFQSK
jgi:hypothetical protein